MIQYHSIPGLVTHSLYRVLNNVLSGIQIYAFILHIKLEYRNQLRATVTSEKVISYTDLTGVNALVRSQH